MELNLFELHPVVAYALDDHWSVGGGVRYLKGSFKQGVNTLPQDFDLNGTPFTTEVLLDASSDVDGFGFDAGVHYTTAVWGWGAVYRSAVTVDGGGDLARSARDLPADAAAAQALHAQLPGSSLSQGLDLPAELRGGVWIAPYPELRLELDLTYQAWGDFQQSFSGPAAPGTPVAIVQRGGWDDTFGARLAVEGDVNDSITVFGGLALRPLAGARQPGRPGLPARRRHGLRGGDDLQLPPALLRPRLLAPPARQRAQRLPGGDPPRRRRHLQRPRLGLVGVGPLAVLKEAR